MVVGNNSDDLLITVLGGLTGVVVAPGGAVVVTIGYNQNRKVNVIISSISSTTILHQRVRFSFKFSRQSRLIVDFDISNFLAAY